MGRYFNAKQQFVETTCPDCGETRKIWPQNKSVSGRCRKCFGKAQAERYAQARGGCAPSYGWRICIDCRQQWECRRDSKAVRCKSCGTKESRNRPDVQARMSQRFKGAGSNLWRGGVTAENKRLRMEARYREWRRSVFQRDGYTCQECGIVGEKLHADHIQPFAQFPDLRFDVTNGRTLCEPCHRRTATYGHRSNVTLRSKHG